MEKEKTNKKDTITIKKDSLWKYSTVVLGVVLIAIVLFSAFPGKTTERVEDTARQPTVPTEPSAVRVSVDDDPILGDPDAKVTIVEFSDYQCPFCRKFYTETLDSIKREYVDTGKVKLVYRDFPLSFHPMAIPSAKAANCAREVGGDEAYFEMHDKIFDEQNVLDGGAVRSTVQFTTEDLKQWAQELGYEIAECIDSNRFEDEIQEDFADGQAAGVRGTPGFVILKGDSGEGVPISGAQPFGVFKQIIDAEL